MSSQPQWEPVDKATGDVLKMVELGPMAPATADNEWDYFTATLRFLARGNDGLILPNLLRPLVKEHVDAHRIGAFTRRAALENLIVADGYEISDDLASRNRGRPMRRWRWIGGEL